MKRHSLTATASQPKLTRACKSCVKAKRKCNLHLPTCSRCQSRDTLCEYENQPLAYQEIVSTQNAKEKENRVHKASPNTTFMLEKPVNPIASLGSIRLDEPIATLTVDRRTFTFLDNLFKGHITSFSQTGTTSFIHPKTPYSPLLAGTRSLMATFNANQPVVYNEGDHKHHLIQIFRTLVAALPTLQDYKTLLPFTQALILIQILVLFVIPSNQLPSWSQETTVAWHHLLKRVSRRLWDTAPTHLPSYLSHHESYALAESIRRTVIMARELQAHYSMYKRGCFEYTPSGVSLVFDQRFELWDADATEFENSMGSSGESQSMVSYREFCDKFDRMEIESIKKPFETMILVGAKGLGTVEQRYGLELTS